MSEYPFEPYSPDAFDETEMLRRATAYFEQLSRRRSVRDFSDRPVPRELIELAIRTAGTAPSGAHRQPWRFVVVSDPHLKRQIRIAAEAEERESYENRMSEEWLAALKPLGTTWQKPFLETAPWLVVVFEQLYEITESGDILRNYYVKESVGIACGLFITALHHMGLVTLTHTPSPMKFLSTLLDRPDNERPFILFPIGYPAPDALVPTLTRKPLTDISDWR